MRRTLVFAALLALPAAPAGAQEHLTAPIRLMLLGDATWRTTERDSAEGFSLGQLVAHLNAGLTDRLTMTTEATLTSRASGAAATIERIILAYHFSDAFRLSAGRYHTPISFWNVHYHHGSWLQTTIERPYTVRYGSPIVPVHFNGLLASGTVTSGASTFSWDLGFGNGRQLDLSSPGDAGDVNDKAAFLAGARYRPSLLGGLEIGVHGYLDEVMSEDIGADVDERIVGAHLVWLSNPEILIEYFNFHHDAEGAADATTSQAAYGQIGWRIPGATSFQPYVRWETIDIAEGDALFPETWDYDGFVGGLRWDFADFGALKGEVRSERFRGDGRALSVLFNASFVVPNIIE